LVRAARGFGGPVEFAVIRKDEVRAIRDVEAALYVNAGLGEYLDFVDQSDGVNDDAHADHSVLLGTKNAARDELEDVLFLADDNGMACVVASGDADNVIKGAGEIVDDFALTFVSPLSADYDDRFHSRPFTSSILQGLKPRESSHQSVGAKAPTP